MVKFKPSTEVCECCNKPVIKIELPQIDEERIREQIRCGQVISAIKDVRQITGLSLAEAKFWVDHSGELIGRGVQAGVCPHCGGDLRTDMAKHCRFCLRDWHDPEHPSFLARKG